MRPVSVLHCTLPVLRVGLLAFLCLGTGPSVHQLSPPELVVQAQRAREQGAFELQERSLLLALDAARLSGDDRSVVQALGELQVHYRSRDRTREALDYLAEEVALLRRLGDEPARLRQRLVDLARTYDALGEPEAAERAWSEAIRLVEEAAPRDSVEEALLLHRVAERFLSMGQGGRAEAPALRSLELAEGKFGSEHSLALMNRRLLIESYRSQGRFAEGMALTREQLRLVEARFGTESEAYHQTLRLLLDLLEEGGSAEEAEVVRARLRGSYGDARQ